MKKVEFERYTNNKEMLELVLSSYKNRTKMKTKHIKNTPLAHLTVANSTTDITSFLCIIIARSCNVVFKRPIFKFVCKFSF